MAVNVTIGGDFCILPPYTSKDLFSDEVESLFGESDLNIVNLECPVADIKKGRKIVKTGPHLRTNEGIFSQLNKLNIKAVTLANNHIYDYGEEGLAITLHHCAIENIVPVGAGKDLAEASMPVIFQVKRLKIAIVNFCENEWSIATGERGGANPLNIIDNLTQIKKARELADFVLVVVHGGHEIYNLPSPRMVKEYRFFAENGADAVIGHHTHCVSGYEVHKKVPIFYSLGNMIFTKNTPYHGWNKGLLVQLKLEKNNPVQFDLYPVVQSKKSFQLSLAKGKSKREIVDEVDGYSEIISDNKNLLSHWDSFVLSRKKTLTMFSPLEVLPWKLPKVFDRLGFNRFLLKKNNLARILNQIRCEAHRDLITTLIQDKIKSSS